MDKKRAFYEHIASHAINNPQNIALEMSNGAKLNYFDLNARANYIAHLLGDQKGKIIGIYTFSDMEYIVALLGVAKAGGAFLPLDSQLPPKRIKEYLQTTQCDTILLSTLISEELRQNLIEEVKELQTSCFLIENNTADTCPEIAIGPNDPAYVMFTSGSTGKAKAVLGNHKGLVHFLNWEIEEFSLDSSIKVSWLAPITFDVSLRDILLPLMLGGTLCIPTEEERTIPHLLANWLVEMKITLVHTIPTVLRMLSHTLAENAVKLPNLKVIIIAGEPLYMRDIVNFRQNAATENQEIVCINIYGPTETTLAKVFYRVPEVENSEDYENNLLPIGNALPNTSILILDEDRLCDLLEIGEIYIRTPYKTLGYINNEEQNKQAFVINPLTNEENDIVYKTGDMGRYLEDGTIECLGRRDNQIKINGIRIEFGEIEFALKDIDIISNAAVTAFETSLANDDKQKMLVAYVVLNESSALEKEEVNNVIRSILLEKLPLAYVPSIIFPLEQLPLTSSGKINRRLLPKPDEMFYANYSYVAPITETEEKLCALWQEIFGRDKISTTLSFTAFGGDSLRSIRAVSLIFKAFNINIPLQHFFEYNTIQELANYIDNNK